MRFCLGVIVSLGLLLPAWASSGEVKALLEPLQRPGVEVWLDKECFAEGDLLIVHVKAERDGFLTLYDLTPDGEVVKLFPNRYSPNARITGGQEFRIPPPGAGYAIRVHIPSDVRLPAYETLWAIVTAVPVSFPDHAETTALLVREVQEKLAGLPSGTWWASTSVRFGYGPCEEGAPSVPQAGETPSADLASLQAAIDRAGANWSAGNTWPWALPEGEREKLCGTVLREPDPERRIEDEALRAPDIELPAHLDWRDVNGDDWTTPIKDQGLCGSCWDFAAVAVLECLLDIESSDPADSPQEIMSEQYLLSYCDNCLAFGRGCQGGYIDAAMAFLTRWGTVTAACFPYAADDELRRETTSCYTRRLLYWYYAGGITRPAKVDEIKTALYLYGPVMTSMAVYEDFFAYEGGVYEHVEGDLVGYHAVLIVGWDDAEEAWICKNSWGPNWGEEGWFRIKWGESQIGRYIFMGRTEKLERLIQALKVHGLYDLVTKLLSPGETRR